MDIATRTTIGALLGAIGSLYLFGWQLGLAIPMLIVLSSVTDFLRWEAIRLGAIIFLAAVFVMLLPDSTLETLSSMSRSISNNTNQMASSRN